jgi:hypothetical protein
MLEGLMLRGVLLLFSLTAALAQDPVVWRFDDPASVGGHRTAVDGSPKIVRTPKGPAIEFDGAHDGIFIDSHPLAGVEKYSWEVVFRPDRGGQPEQRFFHLQENGSENRMLFETRLIGDQWCLDAFVFTPSGTATLLFRNKLHPIGEWYAVAMTYDGEWFRSFVNGVEQGAARVQLTPNGAGKTSIGVRQNRVYHFKGAIREARFTRRALTPAEFLKP